MKYSVIGWDRTVGDWASIECDSIEEAQRQANAVARRTGNSCGIYSEIGTMVGFATEGTNATTKPETGETANK